MATLASSQTGQITSLYARFVVGRGASCDLRPQDPLTSVQHAVFFWADGGWRVKDLASRNGTWIDGYRLERGAEASLSTGLTIAFGNPPVTWTLTDLGPPVAVCVGPDGEPRFATEGLLAVPDENEPLATIYLHHDAWWIEDHTTGTDPEPCPEEHVRLLRGLAWRVVCPQLGSKADINAGDTWELRVTRPIDDAVLRFLVSSDEENVAIHALCGGVAVRLEPRAPNYLLLLLARQRLTDRQRGLGGDLEGWLQIEDLGRMLRMSVSDVNTAIFRARRLFSNAGIEGAARVVERRGRDGRVRLGVAEVTEERVDLA